MREKVLRRVGLTAATLASLGMAPAHAADEPAEHRAAAAAAIAPGAEIGGPSLCPRPDAVWAELVTLVPHDQLAARLRAAANGRTPAVEIVDLGVPYRILIAGQVRVYRDESRDCADRARIAAVFVALAIEAAPAPPPSTGSPALPPIVAAVPAAPAVAPAPTPTLLAARLELGATAVGGLGSDERVGQVGAELRWSAGHHRFGPEAGVAGFLPVENNLGGVRLRQWRVPIDAGVRARFAGPRFERYGELGVAAALLSERALDLARPRSQTAIEVGLRAAIGVYATRGRFAPFAALAAELVPVPPSVFALPAGTIGRTPLLWIGATAGASLSLP